MKIFQNLISLNWYLRRGGWTRGRKTKRMAFVIALGISNSLAVHCQPSASATFAFKWAEENGKPLSHRQFCSTYRILSVYQTEIPVCSQSENENRLEYDSLQNIYFLHLHTIGPRFSFSLIRGKDTMQIVLPVSGKTGLYCTGFSFRKGNYYLNPSDPDNKKPAADVLLPGMPFVNIGKINWKKAAKKYRQKRYNHL